MAAHPAAATPTVGHPPCGKPRGNLDDLLEMCRTTAPAMFNDIFFIGKDNCPKPELRHLIGDGDTTVRCSGCGKRIDEHPASTRPKRECPAHPTVYKLVARVISGASLQDLRKRVYEVAESCFAHFLAVDPEEEEEDGDQTSPPTGHIRYSEPVSGESDLEIELYFPSYELALRMTMMVAKELRDKWRSATDPVSSVVPVTDGALLSCHRVTARHYDRSRLAPVRVPWVWDNEDDGERSAETTVSDEETLALESVVNVASVDYVFEKCHINADIKHTPADTEGNWIPLPSNCHRLFDGKTISRRACVSIAPQGKLDDVKGDRQGVRVHVYFSNDCTQDTLGLAGCLRDATLVRKNVFAVVVWKREADKFISELQARHNKLTQEWHSVP